MHHECASLGEDFLAIGIGYRPLLAPLISRKDALTLQMKAENPEWHSL
jgi:hypothetical protein